ncbi:Hypothetical predicted protein [Octopus vulgaris]|uniref:Uncharacterized protein n=1 Tax=Octopus vulgaris TaxID=6645 RepID=A0AA36AQP9_OCTVU|nr:Hypothetical predicted protein [Octopus vulgaris]
MYNVQIASKEWQLDVHYKTKIKEMEDVQQKMKTKEMNRLQLIVFEEHHIVYKKHHKKLQTDVEMTELVTTKTDINKK